jgi:hypothetical protein
MKPKLQKGHTDINAADICGTGAKPLNHASALRSISPFHHGNECHVVLSMLAVGIFEKLCYLLIYYPSVNSTYLPLFTLSFCRAMSSDASEPFHALDTSNDDNTNITGTKFRPLSNKNCNRSKFATLCNNKKGPPIMS